MILITDLQKDGFAHVTKCSYRTVLCFIKMHFTVNYSVCYNL